MGDWVEFPNIIGSHINTAASCYRVLAPGELDSETLERAAKVADDHLARITGHHSDVPMEDSIAEGYGNAALNIGVSIRVLKRKPR